jgi:hypothetical protein
VDPARAPPLLTFSVFVDYADHELDLTMVRTDVIAKTIDDQEALKVVANMIDAYRKDELIWTRHTFKQYVTERRASAKGYDCLESKY